MNYHFSGYGRANCLIARAIRKHGRENFVSVILLSAIEKQENLNLAEIVVIKHLNCLAPEKGYNIHPGGRGGPMPEKTKMKMSEAHKRRKRSERERAHIATMIESQKKAVIITLLKTGMEMTYLSAKAAAKAMGRSGTTISELVLKKTKKSKGKGGKYDNANTYMERVDDVLLVDSLFCGTQIV